MRYLILTMLLFGCDSNAGTTNKSKYVLKCEYVNNYVYRCENKEVICYSPYPSDGGLFCKFKEKQ